MGFDNSVGNFIGAFIGACVVATVMFFRSFKGLYIYMKNCQRLSKDLKK